MILWLKEHLEMVGGRFGAAKGNTFTVQIPFTNVLVAGKVVEYSVESKLEGL